MNLPAGGDELLAHGLSGATDLPIPSVYAMVGATGTLTISFAVLALAWKEPRFGLEPDSETEPPRRKWLAGLGGGIVFGPRWFDRADPFDVYSAIVARLSPGVRDGRWGPAQSAPVIVFDPS